MEFGSLEQLNLNGNKLLQIFYPDPFGKGDDASATSKGECPVTPFPTLRCLLLGTCVFTAL